LASIARFPNLSTKGCATALSLLLVVAVAVQSASVVARETSPLTPTEAVPEQQALVNQFCLACHSATGKAGGLVLQGLDPTRASAHPDVWEKVIRKIRSGEMPPPGGPRPDASVLTGFVGKLISNLDLAAERAPYAGRPVVRRINRTEYANAIRDLLAIDQDFASDLPPDGVAAGFDNIGDALSMSPLLLERYIKTAHKISRLAVGTGDSMPIAHEFRATKTQAEWQGRGMPFGTRGGVLIRHYFPFDGDYQLRAFLDTSSGLSPVEGVRFFQLQLPVKAGSHTFIATFPNDFAKQEGPSPNLGGPGGAPLGGPVDVLADAVRFTIEFLFNGRRLKVFEIKGPTTGEAAFGTVPGPPTLEKVEIVGPYNAVGPGATPSRQKLFVCLPKGESEETRCASEILTRLARRAYRRDLNTEDSRRLMAAYTSARQNGRFDEAISEAVAAVLIAPDFLFRLEFDKPGALAGSVQKLSGFELATRLSFFLWRTIPDDDLLALARIGRLESPAVLSRQVERMLADPRSDTLVDDFAMQWLKLHELEQAQPDPKIYPEFDAGLRGAFEEETRLFLRSVLREDVSIMDLIGADYTFLNGRLAKHYGISNVSGPGFRRVSLTQHGERGGILGQGSILTMTSHTTKTSPVLRGNWILTNLLNSPPPPPPPGVPPLDESAVDGKPLTTRQKVERHRASPACSSCHARMDPLGFALENFDAVGKWRTTDEGGTIDPSGQLPNGEVVAGPNDLRHLLVRHSAEFVEATVARLLTYALGRELDAQDQPTVRKIVREAEPGRYKFSDLIKSIVRSAPFQMRQTSEGS